MEIKRLREKGHRITLLNEQQFWRLVSASAKVGSRQRPDEAVLPGGLPARTAPADPPRLQRRRARK
jgi:hypothetical protein